MKGAWAGVGLFIKLILQGLRSQGILQRALKVQDSIRRVIIQNLPIYIQMNEEKLGNVKVVCRFRPINERQRAQGQTLVHELLDDKTVMIKDNTKAQKNNNAEPLKFSFDRVFDCDTRQAEVYNYAAASVIDSVIEGFNGTIFAYGQTSSGKTHTMEGEIAQSVTQNSGIIPRMVIQVFDSISKCSENIEFRIKISMVQLYMQKLRDLIDTSKTDLKIRSDKKRGIFIQNLTETYISSAEQVYNLMEIARSTRAIAATNMNQRSSRSHLLFILTISQNNIQDMSAKTGKLYLVDLAGSEKISKTGAEGKVLDEAKKINVSLTALGKVINALTDGKSTHVPYRDSKLTRVLQQSLGGNSKTTLIVTCSPHVNNISQTISSLRFGISAKKIKNKPKINKQLTVAQLQNLLEKVEKELEEKTKYIDQLKNYITADLKQKSVPAYSSQKNAINNAEQQQEQQTDLVGELQRQLQIERNLNLVQQQQLNSLKQKYQKILTEKQSLEQSLNTARNDIEELQTTKPASMTLLHDNTLSSNLHDNSLAGGITIQTLITDLSAITEDERVFAYLQERKNLSISESQPEDYNKLLQDYETERERSKRSEEKHQKYEKTMQKKLSQLENNICQLNHAYYDLLIIQQRHKVDNIFLKKKLEEKDMSIASLKDRIKDLEDQNRDLEEQRWNDDEDGPSTANLKKNLQKFAISEEQENKLNELCERRNGQLGAQNGTSTKVVKVLRGGNK